MVTNEIVPNIRLVPLLIIMATPSPAITTIGSIHDVVVSINIMITTKMANTVTKLTSFTVPVVATAVDTAFPVMALSSPIMSRILLTVATFFSSSMVTVNNAFESL